MRKKYLKRLLCISLATLLITAPSTVILKTLAEETENYSVTIGNEDPSYNTDSNLINGKSPAVVQWDDGTDAATVDSGVRGRWTDGGFVKGENSGENPITMSAHKSLRVAYDLENMTDISQVIFAGTDNGYASDYASVDGCWNAAIRVYVGNDVNSLFNDAQKVTDITNSSWVRVFDITYHEGKHPNGKYIGFEVVKYGEYPVFIEELIVFGKSTGEPEPEKAYTVTAEKKNETDIKQAISDSHANNILAGKDVTVVNSTDGNTWSQNCTPAGLTNGQASFPVNVGENDAPAPRFIFDMESKHRISDVLLFAHWGTSGLKHREYTVSVADSKEKLFTDNETARLSYQNSSADVDVIHFNYADETKRPEGRYIGIEIHGNSDNGGGNIQMQEIAAYGENTVPEPEKDYTVTAEKIVDNDALEEKVKLSYADNILADKPAKAMKASDNAAWTVGHNSMEWCDGRYNFPINVGTDGLDSPLRFVFDAKEEYEITKLMLFAHLGGSGLNHSKYTISIADSRSDLFTEKANGTIVYKNPGNLNVFTFEYKDGSEKPKGRWIGIEIHGNSAEGGNIQMREIAVYGAKTGTPVIDDPSDNFEYYENYTVQINGLTTNDVSARAAQNLLLGLEPTLTNDAGFEGKFLNGNHWNLVDGAIYQEGHADYASPNGDNEPMRFTYDLLQTVPIDQFLIVHYYYRKGNINFTSNEYELYVSNDRSTLYDAENRVFNYVNANNYDPSVPYSGTQQFFTFTGEKPVGRYVGVRMVNLSAADNTGRLDQLAVYSEGKIPMDASVAQTFEDPDTGIKVSVLRSRSSDLFDSAKALRITRTPLSFEAQSTANDLHLNIIDSAYQIELLNENGNALTYNDLGGRVIKIEFPMPAGDQVNNKRLCRINDGRLEQLPYTFYGKDYITTFQQGVLGTVAIFADTLSGSAQIGAADIDLENGMDGIGIQTGDTAAIGAVVLVLVLSLAALVIFKKRIGEEINK